MPKDLFIKDVPDDIYNKLEEVSRQTGRSKKDIVIEALVLRLTGMQHSVSGELVEITEPKLTILKFEAKCARCNQKISAGEEAFLAKAKYKDGERWIAWHFSCLMTDKQLTRLYLEVRKLKRIRDQLKKEVEELADTVLNYEARKSLIDKVFKLVQETSETLSMLREYMVSVERTQDIQSILESLRDLNKELESFGKQLAEVLLERPRVPVVIKRSPRG
jgi:hypothetical protein